MRDILKIWLERKLFSKEKVESLPKSLRKLRVNEYPMWFGLKKVPPGYNNIDKICRNIKNNIQTRGNLISQKTFLSFIVLDLVFNLLFGLIIH